MSETPDRVRTTWAVADPLLQRYYDEEWGEVVTEEAALFERLTLECFQAGLSWLTILKKRDAFRVAFTGFDPDLVSNFSETEVTELLDNPQIIRNEQKIRATIQNAQAVVKLRSSATPFAQLVWSHMPDESPAPKTDSDVPTCSAESAALARSLQKHGFRFVGPTNMYALMTAIGMVDTHIIDSFRRGCSGLWEQDGTRTQRKVHLELHNGSDLREARPTTVSSERHRVR